MRISVVIPTRGRIDALRLALDSVRKQVDVGPTELIVVDDAASPPLPDLPADVTVVRFQQAVGACQARNAGVAIATGDLLLFLDDDAELETTDILVRSLAWFAARPALATIGYRQLTTSGEIHYMQPCTSQVPALCGLFFSYGCMIRREHFNKVGGFNELFGYYFEENELSLKLFAAGYETIYDPTLLVRHHQNNQHRNNALIRRLNSRNICISFLQHYPALMLPALFAKRLVLHARQNGFFLPPLSDVVWVARQILQRSGAIWRKRRSLGWATVVRFHKLCKHACPIPIAAKGSES